MKKIPLFLAIIFSLSLFAEPQNGVVYVKAGASGTGASWADAMGDIQAAIGEAKIVGNARKDVWVAAGEFTITTCINMIDSVNVYGSFAGTETTLAERAKVVDGKMWDFVNPTTLTGSGARIVQSVGNLDMETVFDGFILTGGNGNGSATNGAGGAAFLRPNFALQNCIVKNNTSTNAGGGVSMYPGGTIRYCLVKDNVHTTGASGAGGVNVNTTVGNFAYIQNCEITGNSSTIRGGAINTQGAGITYVSNNKIYNNKAADGATLKGGGALYISAVEASNNLIYNNTGGTAIYINGGAMYNNTVVKNVGGVYVAGGVTKVSNNIVWACATDEFGDTPTSIGGAAATTFTMYNNATYNPLSTDKGWIIADNFEFSSNANNGNVADPKPGTIGSGPKFVVVSGFYGVALDAAEKASLDTVNWELQVLSPCVDAGINVEAITTDFAGLSRPQGFPIATAKFDIGAYELPYYTVIAGEDAEAAGEIYDALGEKLDKDFAMGFARGSKIELYFYPASGSIFRAYYTISNDNGLTFTGDQVDFTSEIDADDLWTSTVEKSFKITVEWLEPNAVKSLRDSGIKCFGTHNGVEIQGLSASKEVKILNMSGMQMSKTTANGSNMFIPLRTGVYFVVLAEGAQKVIVK